LKKNHLGISKHEGYLRLLRGLCFQKVDKCFKY
jgi:hypothetical protein